MSELENIKKYMLLGSELPITLKKCTEYEILLIVLSLPPIGFIMILSILVDTFYARISMPKQQNPENHNISAA